MHELWDAFAKSGKIEDYLAFKHADKNENVKRDVTKQHEHKDGRPGNT